MKVVKKLALFAALSLGLGGIAVAQSTAPQVGEPVSAVSINADLRNLPTVQQWQPGDPIKEAQRRIYHPLEGRVLPHAPASWSTAPDRLGDLQASFDMTNRAPSAIDASSRVSINNLSTGVSPGDPVVEVNANYIMYGINGSSGTTFTVYNKSGVKLSGPTAYKTLAPAGDPCATSVSDPIIHWDRLANRWFMLEMGGTSSANRLCVYVSKTDNPVSGGWWFYGFATPAVPDYPHCSVWHNAYVCTTNESSTGAKVYAFDRANMLTGATARAAQRFTTVAKLAGYGFQALTPATFMGPATSAPPANAPILLARHNDDEAHAGTGANTSLDFIDLYALNLNWTTPASSSITTLPRINITEFNSWFDNAQTSGGQQVCGGYDCFDTVPQPGSTALLDPIREVIMNSMVYRNFGTHESVVGSFSTNQNTARTGTVVDAGIRWFEIRKSGAGAWALHQEGTFSPGDANTHHLIGSIASDGVGNIGMSFNKSKTSATTVFPSLMYTGRLNTDALGVMSQGENMIATGTAVETSGRWGDYHQTVVDPADDCTFWTVGMYRPSGSWNTSIRDFKFSNCGGPPPVTYTVSGLVTTGTGVGISGVTVSNGSASSTTDGAGSFTILNVANGSYTLTPSASGYTFSPVNRAITVSGANLTAQNFTGTATVTTYSISGRVATAASAGINGVTVSTGAASATTNSNGDYTISNLANGTYTLTPSLSGYTFSPTSLAATVSGANLTGRNFTGTATTGAIALSSGVTVSSSTNSATANSNWKDFTVAIPAGASNLTIATTGAGDLDLHVKFGAQATLTVYDCRPYGSTGAESCPFATPSVGTYYARVYGYATGVQNFTITATWTVGGGGGGTPTERMANGKFDTITTSTNTAPDGSWLRFASTGTSFNTLLAGQTNAHSGGSYAYLGVNATTSTQTVDSKSTAIPATATTATLSFQTSIVTSETGTTAYDKLVVEVIDASTNAVLSTLVTLSNANKTTSASTYVLRSYNVIAHKGKNVKLRLRGSTDSSLATTFRVDSVSLMANQ